MQRGLFVLIAIGLLAGTTAQIIARATPSAPVSAVADDGTIRTPRFQDFPVSVFSEFRGEANVNFIVLEDNVTGQPITYAGRYYVATESCGEDCQVSEVIDVGTGKVVADHLYSQFGLVYVKDSLLLVVNPEGVRGTDYTTDYYVLDGGELTMLFKVEASGEIVRECPDLPVEATHSQFEGAREFASQCKVPSGWEVVRG